MKATGFNHVSINAQDLEESIRFYTEVFGMEKIPTYNFGFPVQYLRLGDLQLHIFERGEKAPASHHFGMDVDDFEAAYTKATELQIHDSETFGSEIYELPDGSVQMYIRDPGGNLVEIDWPDVTTLDHSVLPKFKKLDDRVSQTGEALHATLYLRLHEERRP
jgi:catechol 2,3-dioxygenase-like lactoylglutathione lyase family enzyme